ncbi:MAG: YihY/virulence factor BrkB family protein [Pirellulaceae bacterium]|nr:YihY/virulence factor BrkB family protein [Pirellulaceae bacterium]
MIRLLALIGRSAQETLRHWNRIHGSLLAASVSFYACFCVFPVILILLASFGFFLQNTVWGQGYEQGLIRYLADQTSESLAEQVQSLLHQVETAAIVSGPVGVFCLLMTALTLFVNFERCFAIIWERTDRSQGLIASAFEVLLHRIRGFMLLLMIACLIMVNFVSYFAIEMIAKWLGEFHHSQRWWQLSHLASSLTLNALLFSMIYRTLPRQRIWWRHAFQGGCLAALTWEVGRYFLAWLIISDNYHTFGVVGVFMGLMMWAYYGTYVVLLGATLTRVTAHARETAARQRRQDARPIENSDTETMLLQMKAMQPYHRKIALDGAWTDQPARRAA